MRLISFILDPREHPKTMDGPYRPKNLLRYLAQHPELHSELAPDVPEAVRAV